MEYYSAYNKYKSGYVWIPWSPIKTIAVSSKCPFTLKFSKKFIKGSSIYFKTSFVTKYIYLKIFLINWNKVKLGPEKIKNFPDDPLSKVISVWILFAVFKKKIRYKGANFLIFFYL